MTETRPFASLIKLSKTCLIESKRISKWQNELGRIERRRRKRKRRGRQRLRGSRRRGARRN